MKIAMRREGYALVPVDEESARQITMLDSNRSFLVKVSQPRNERHHRLLWALLRKVWDNLSDEDRAEYPEPSSLLAAVKVALGYYDMVRGATGRTTAVLRSTSFENMDQGEFRRFFNGAVGVLNERFVRVENAELKREILEMTQ